MGRFRYRGKSREGQVLTGVMEVDSKDTAAARLRERGLFVTSLKEVQESTLLAMLQPQNTLKAKHLAMLCRQFAIELGSGMSLISSLQLLEEEAPDPRLKKALLETRLDVASGSSFSRALDKHSRLFPTVFLSLVEAGEIAGVLPTVLERLATYYEREDELNKKVSEALMYPAFIGSVAVVLVFALLFFVLPMLVGNFASFGVSPPPITQAFLSFRQHMIQYWYVVLLVLTGVVAGVRMYLRTDHGHWRYDRIRLMLPVVGELQKMVIFARFARTLGLLLQSGISMLQSLQILRRLVGNVVISDGLREARLGIEKGEGLSAPLRNHKLFAALLVQMISVGEETGNLEGILLQIAEYYDREVNFSVAAFTKLLEPAIMLVLAVVVLFILISIYLPMMQMVTQI